jgi:hypothetical protein
MVAPSFDHSSTRSARVATALAITFVAVAASACGSASKHPTHAAVSGGTSGSSDADANAGMGGDAQLASDAAVAAPPAFEAVAVTAYLAKVKNLLVALPASDDEVKRVQADPTQLKPLIGEWMKLPQYNDKLQRFFELAFQQTQISAEDFADQVYPDRIGIHPTTTPQLVQNAKESFARTMVALVNQDKPLSAGVNTQQLMMTTALKELYAFLDTREVDDDGAITDHFRVNNPKLKVTVSTASGPIPIADTLNAKSTNYMHWYNPDLATASPAVAGCNADPYVFAANSHLLHYLLYGSLDAHKNDQGMNCQVTRGSATAPQFQDSDFTDWQMVSLRAPNTGEATSLFYDLPSLRSAKELVLSIPRIGFFSTPAFFANWQTNTSNQMRVTLNQTLIVSLGQDVNGTDGTVAPGDPPPGLDTAHAGAAECAFCHRSLDPLRSIFAATYSWNYHTQLDSTFSGQKGAFAFHGVIANVNNMGDFATQVSMHPMFAAAWTQKLCYYANSSPCMSDDPEFQRVVKVFSDANYSFNTLVQELFSSALVTNASSTATAQANGEVLAVARRDHLCAALTARLGLPDVCGIDALSVAKLKGTIAQIALGLPSDGYGRGATAPVLPNQATLFYSAATENICTALAPQVIDVAAAKQVSGAKSWSSSSSPQAIAEFVSLLMGLPASDARSGPATDALTRHYKAAMSAGANASNALKSTFITACLAPSSVSIGL